MFARGQGHLFSPEGNVHSTRKETERRRGKRGKPQGGDAWGARMGNRTA